MVLRRVAFECENGTIQLAVLCVGCYAELTSRIGTTKRWSNDLDEGCCEFCELEIRRVAAK